MFQIRSEQLVAFADYAIDDFIRRMLVHLRRQESVASISDSQLRRIVTEGIEHAARHSIYSENEVCLYIECLVALGADFLRIPWVESILARSGQPLNQQLQIVLEEAEKLRGPAAVAEGRTT